MSTIKGPLIRLIMTVAHMAFCQSDPPLLLKNTTSLVIRNTKQGPILSISPHIPDLQPNCGQFAFKLASAACMDYVPVY